MTQPRWVTSAWIKERETRLADFAWQGGYGAFSVSQSDVARVVEFIRRQEEHHRRFDFKSELRTLLERERPAGTLHGGPGSMGG